MTERRPLAPKKRILILAPNWLGDVVMTTPLISLLADAMPAGEIVLAIRRRWAPLFVADPRLADRFPIERTGRHRGAGGLVRLARDLRALAHDTGGFDGVIVAPPSLRGALAVWAAGLPLRVGYRSDGRGLLLNEALPVPPRGGRHYSREMVELGLRLLERLNVECPAGNPIRMPSLPGCRSGSAIDRGKGAETPELWVVAPGTTYGEAKTWPIRRVGDLLELAVRQAGVRVALLGDEAARVFARQLRSGSSLPWREDLAGEAGIIDLTGRTDLAGAAAVLGQARAFVGNDSGLMHVAAALGVATVGIFGSSNPDWTAPLGPSTAFVVAEGFSCRPCYRKTCDQPEFCLEQVEAETVFEQVHRLLAGRTVAGEGS